ncbi:MAG: DNA-processing protein DprA [Clostridia bacterium]
MNEIDQNTKILLALQYVDELSNKKKSALVFSVSKPAQILETAQKARIIAAIGSENAKIFQKQLDDIENIINNMRARKISWVTYLDAEYPKQLLQIDDFPLVLFLKGNTSLLENDMIAVVGTRRPTRYGVKVTEDFTKEFASAGLVVVSGFARGVDSTAHRACINVEAPTVAIFACGLDSCYPAENKSLYDGILQQNGLIITEYPLGVKPLQYHFPERNRIISGLSRAVFLPEATEKSGSLITIRLAIEQGRDIYVAPANIYSEEGAGSNALIREMPDCVAFCADDVLDAMHIKRRKAEPICAEQLSIAELQIVDALHDGELHFEELLNKCGLQVGELNSLLMNLELNGKVEQSSCNYYALC